MGIDKIKMLVSSAFAAGYQMAQVDGGLRTDKLRRKEAEALLSRHGLKAVVLDRWIAEGLVEEHKGLKNSPRWYSLNEINKVLTSIQIKDLSFTFSDTTDNKDFRVWQQR